MRRSTGICVTSLQWHNKFILSFSNSNNNSTKDNKLHKGFSKGHSVFGAGERGTRAETDLSCLTDTLLLGLKIPSLSWRVPVNVPYLSWRVPVIPYLSWWVPVCRSSSWRSHLVHLLVTRIWLWMENWYLSSGYLKHVPALSVHYIICTLKIY